MASNMSIMQEYNSIHVGYVVLYSWLDDIRRQPKTTLVIEESPV